MTPLFSDADLQFVLTSLGAAELPLIEEHLKRLDHEDRYLRFFATLSDSSIERYTRKVMNLDKGRAFGIFKMPERRLIAVAHVSEMQETPTRVAAEVGFSVDKEFRGRGLSNRLMDRVITYCQASGINTLFMSCLRENKKMQAVAKKFNLKMVIDANEAVAELNLDETDREKAVAHEIAYKQIEIYDKAFRQNKAMVQSLFGE